MVQSEERRGEQEKEDDSTGYSKNDTGKYRRLGLHAELAGTPSHRYPLCVYGITGRDNANQNNNNNGN
jgi:hypothetical protein